MNEKLKLCLSIATLTISFGIWKSILESAISEPCFTNILFTCIMSFLFMINGAFFIECLITVEKEHSEKRRNASEVGK